MRIFFLLLILIATGCKDSIEEKTIDFKTNLLEVKLLETTPVNPRYTQLIATDSGEYLLLLNDFKDQFQFHELPSGKKAHEIAIQREGEHGVSGFDAGTVTGWDSLWVTNRPPSLVLTNFSGEVLKKVTIIDDQTPLTVIRSDFDRRIHQYGNKIFGSQPLFMDHHGMNKDAIQKQRLVFSLEINTGDVKWYDVFYREDYWDKGKKPSGYSWTEKDGKLYIAPWHDHEIQVFDMASETIVQRKEVKSFHVNKFNMVNEIPPREKALSNLFSSDRYKNLLYDKYRNVFYRFFLPSFDPENLEEEYNHLDLEFSRPYSGVMVLDSELNIIGEHIFDKFQVYTTNNHFVGEKGLYISANNPFNPEYDEDMLRYLIFTTELGEE